MENREIQEQMAMAIPQLSISLDIINDAKDDIKRLIEKLTYYCERSEEFIQEIKIKKLSPEIDSLNSIEWTVACIKIYLKNIKKNLNDIEAKYLDAKEYCSELEK